MDLEEFHRRREPEWQAFERLLDQAGRNPGKRLAPDAALELGRLYRAASGDLAFARRRFRGGPTVARLEMAVRRGRDAVYAYRPERVSVWGFLTTGYWRRVRERPWLLLLAGIVMFLPWTLASVWAVRDPVAAAGLAPAGAESVIDRPSADFGLSAEDKAAAASAIFTNNIRVVILVFAAGIAAAIGGLLVLAYQGVALGSLFGLTIEAGNASVLWEFVLPHGVLELSCIIVAGVAGMRMGWSMVAPGRRRRLDALQAEARAAGEIVVGTALCLVVAGLIEGLVSTSGVGVPAGIVIGVGVGALYWGLVFWRGRPAAVAVPAASGPLLADPVRPAF